MSLIRYRYDRRQSRSHVPTTDLEPVVKMLQQALEQHGEFVFAVSGDSMKPTIQDGEQLLVRRQDSPLLPGEVVVARGRNGLYAHRVRFVDKDQVITMGDNNALVDEPIAHTDVLGVAKTKLVNGKAFPLDKTDFPPLVSICDTGRTVITVVGCSDYDRQQLTALAQVFPIEVRYCSNMAEVMGMLGGREYKIGICPQGPVSEEGILKTLRSLPTTKKINFVLGAQFGYDGNRLGLLPHGAVDMLARLGRMSLQPFPLCATAGYLIGLVQGAWGQSGQQEFKES